MKVTELNDDNEQHDDEAQAILHAVLTFFGLILIGLIYFLFLPFRWLPYDSQVLNLPFFYIGVIIFFVIIQLTLRRLSQEGVMVFSEAVIDASGLVLLLFPVTPTRGYIEPGQPFGFVFGFQTLQWPLFLILGVSVIVVTRELRKPVGREPTQLLVILSVLGGFALLLNWFLFPILLELIPSHIAALCLSIQPPITYYSGVRKLQKV